MASIDLTSGTAGAYGAGELQLQGKVQMTSTLTPVTDNLNVASPLLLSTTLVQTTSTLKITTNDNPYIDAEDGAGNNRFTVGRATSSQQVNVDFASNPVGSTTAVGAIRTFRDGTNLSEAMTFIEDGSVGIGTTAPVGILDIYKSAANTRFAIRGDAGFNRLISYRTGALQRFGLYVNNTAESGANAGSDFAIRAYNDAGTLLSTPLFIQRSTGNVGVGTTAPTAGYKLDIAGRIKAYNLGYIADFVSTESNASSIQLYADNSNVSIVQNGTASVPLTFFLGGTERMRIATSGNVGIGTTSPNSKLEISAGVDIYGENITSSSGVATTTGISMGSFVGLPGGSNGSVYIASAHNHSATAQSSMVMYTHTGSALTEKMRITDTGNVGIGTTTPFQKLSLGTPNTGATEVQSYNTTDQFCFNFGYVPAGLFPRMNDIIACGSADGTNGASNIRFFTNPVSSVNANEKMRITGDGYVRLSTNSGGIQFNGDTAAANALDDYEEGNWSPLVTFGGAGVGITYAVNNGFYTKIGNQVTTTCYILLTSQGSSTGAARIEGLPFNINASSRAYSAASFAALNAITSNGTIQGYGNLGVSTIDLVSTSVTGTQISLTHLNFTNATQIIMTFTYFV